ncbi:MAG TPA: hypothetical protein DCE78_12285 [Bacteroidetes bacterium]|nr:hypothetical protein [Bacteroidota bacterium]
MKKTIILVFGILFFMVFAINSSVAQTGIEPEVREMNLVRSPLDDGLHNALSFGLTLNNFGFGLGTEYRRVISPMSEFIMDFQISALRDITEQNYQFFGQQIIPNKRNRIMSFPLIAGFKQRLFAESISDNFRLYVSGMGGGTAAYVYPYYQTRDVFYVMLDDAEQFSNGDLSVQQYGPVEANTGQISNDMFQGWGDGEWKFGAAGQLGVGVDFGENFKSLTSVKVGFTFQYYPEGIQVMDPLRVLGYFPGNETYADTYVVADGTPKQKFFGSPYITLVFGRMW